MLNVQSYQFLYIVAMPKPLSRDTTADKERAAFEKWKRVSEAEKAKDPESYWHFLTPQLVEDKAFGFELCKLYCTGCKRHLSAINPSATGIQHCPYFNKKTQTYTPGACPALRKLEEAPTKRPRLDDRAQLLGVTTSRAAVPSAVRVCITCAEHACYQLCK